MKQLFVLIISMVLAQGLSAQEVEYTMPHEGEPHEGTWIAWPHDYTYGWGNRLFSEQVWVDMTTELVQGEKVYIIAYNQSEQNHIESLLINEGIAMDQVEFYIAPNDDYWMRDNGPIYVYDEDNNLQLTDWGFNGWGFDYPYELDDDVPIYISNLTGTPRIDLSAMVLEGGSIEIDGTGAVLLCRSSITNPDRNPNLTEEEVEDYLTQYLGLTHFIWLDGIPGFDITDFHIDGFARFLNDHTIVTMNEADLLDYGCLQSDVNTLLNATDAEGVPYDYFFLPQTQNNVSNYWGDPLGYKGSYVNYYEANESVLVPTYNDPNDDVAVGLIQQIYPDKNVIGIDVSRIYEYGGMIHCITQQQPVDLNTVGQAEFEIQSEVLLYPNPAKQILNVRGLSGSVQVVNMLGEIILEESQSVIDVSRLPAGAYFVRSQDQVLGQFMKVD